MYAIGVVWDGDAMCPITLVEDGSLSFQILKESEAVINADVSAVQALIDEKNRKIAELEAKIIELQVSGRTE
tara:strand:+ start:1530 stop:1745 length:216 start_codon:yes stop_codon:yes gene_type:complete